jgi:hypothetical protein
VPGAGQSDGEQTPHGEAAVRHDALPREG